jgi:hypothetical protein
VLSAVVEFYNKPHLLPARKFGRPKKKADILAEKNVKKRLVNPFNLIDGARNIVIFFT